MNLYFLVEGRRTERIIYPAWLKILLPDLDRVNWAYQAKNNSYFLFSGNGYPSLLHNHLVNSIEEINGLKNFNYLVLVLDVDETSVDIRIKEVLDFIKIENIELRGDCKLIIIPQNRCIETWLLGNRDIFKGNPRRHKLINYVRFYNVKDLDPELMGIYTGFNTHSQFHADYCSEFLRERKIRYTKNNPNEVTKEYYLEKLIERNEETSHINSFGKFIEFCGKVKEEMAMH